MSTLVGMVRVTLVLLLAVVTLSFVMGIGTATTGWIERIVLVGLIAGCVFLAAQISSVTARVQGRLHRH